MFLSLSAEIHAITYTDQNVKQIVPLIKNNIFWVKSNDFTKLKLVRDPLLLQRLTCVAPLLFESVYPPKFTRNLLWV